MAWKCLLFFRWISIVLLVGGAFKQDGARGKKYIYMYVLRILRLAVIHNIVFFHPFYSSDVIKRLSSVYCIQYG